MFLASSGSAACGKALMSIMCLTRSSASTYMLSKLQTSDTYLKMLSHRMAKAEGIGFKVEVHGHSNPGICMTVMPLQVMNKNLNLNRPNSTWCRSLTDHEVATYILQTCIRLLSLSVSLSHICHIHHSVSLYISVSLCVSLYLYISALPLSVSLISTIKT